MSRQARSAAPSGVRPAAFIAAASDVVDSLTGPEHDQDNTWVNVVNAPDGAWGIGGRAYTGEDLVSAVASSAQLARTP